MKQKRYLIIRFIGIVLFAYAAGTQQLHNHGQLPVTRVLLPPII